MAKIIFENFGDGALSGTFGISDTSLTLSLGQGVNYPSPTAGDYFAITITDAATALNHEICYVYGRTGDVLSPIVRAREGTTAQTWVVGDFVQNNYTAGTARAFVQADDLNAALLTLLQNKVYPIGCSYTSFTTTDNPNTILGFGTWVAAPGIVVVGYDASQTEFNALLKTGGANNISLTMTSETRTSASVPPSSFPPQTRAINANGTFCDWFETGDANNPNGVETRFKISQSSVLQPYIVAAIWRRTA